MNASDFDGGMWRRRARLVEGIDGDTVRILVEGSFGSRHEIALRIVGLDAPEATTNAGRLATRGLLDLFALHEVWSRGETGWPLRVETLRRASGAEVRSFARWVGYLWVVAAAGEMIDVSAEMIGAGLAIPA